MKALAAVAIESDVGVTKDSVDEVIHCRLFELASLAGGAGERAGALDLLLKEFVNAVKLGASSQRYAKNRTMNNLALDTAVLAAEHSTRNAVTSDFAALVLSGVGLKCARELPVAFLERAVERLALSDPELEVARLGSRFLVVFVVASLGDSLVLRVERRERGRGWALRTGESDLGPLAVELLDDRRI